MDKALALNMTEVGQHCLASPSAASLCLWCPQASLSECLTWHTTHPPSPAQFEGHHIRVDRAAPASAKGAVAFDHMRTLFVGNLPHDCEVRCAARAAVPRMPCKLGGSLLATTKDCCRVDWRTSGTGGCPNSPKTNPT